MTDNSKLARWQGWKAYNGTWSAPETLLPRTVPDYLNDDAAAMSLLDTLVEKKLRPELWHNEKLWQFEVWERADITAGLGTLLIVSEKPTRREAVVAACLELIEKTNQTKNWCEVEGISP